MINKDDLEEARLIGGVVALRWGAPYEMMKTVMTAQELHEMLRDFDNAIMIVEQEFWSSSPEYKAVRAMRERWFP
jgi:hypothetical protein